MRQFLDQVLLSDVSEPLVLIDAVRVFLADLDGSVLAETIDYDNLVRPCDALKAAADLFLFIAGCDARRYLFTHGCLSLSALWCAERTLRALVGRSPQIESAQRMPASPKISRHAWYTLSGSIDRSVSRATAEFLSIFLVRRTPSRAMILCPWPSGPVLS
jgi:hypothetical protein